MSVYIFLFSQIIIHFNDLYTIVLCLSSARNFFLCLIDNFEIMWQDVDNLFFEESNIIFLTLFKSMGSGIHFCWLLALRQVMETRSFVGRFCIFGLVLGLKKRSNNVVYFDYFSLSPSVSLCLSLSLCFSFSFRQQELLATNH